MQGAPCSPGRRRFSVFGMALIGPTNWSAKLLTDAIPELRRRLDSPRCALEQNSIIAPSRARFRPSDGGTTGAVRCAPAGKLMLSGMQFDHDIVVVSGLGGLVQRIDRTGQEAWSVAFSEPRGIAVVGDEVLVGNGRTIFRLDKLTGQENAKITFDWRVSGFCQRGEYLAVAFRAEGAGVVRLYQLTRNAAREVSAITDTLRYPRAVLLTDNGLFVADTFGHRVVKFGRSGSKLSKMSAETKSFFPNSTRMLGGKLLVAEEHINQIGGFDPSTLARMPAAVICGSDSLNQPLAVLISRVNAHSPDGESVCLARNDRGGALLAPNDAVGKADALYVADTDNHRIVMYRSGQPSAVLSNFNEPVNVDIIS